MKEWTDLLEAARKRDKLLTLFQLMCSPKYEAPWWYWQDFLRSSKN